MGTVVSDSNSNPLSSFKFVSLHLRITQYLYNFGGIFKQMQRLSFNESYRVFEGLDTEYCVFEGP